ncbi:chromosomal replication initiator protein DnaA [bacterium]|nr:chromosomal replication initiator protein DnaA [bacterium]
MTRLATPRPLLAKQGNQTRDDAAHEAWMQVSTLIESALPEQAFHTWFRPIQPVQFRDGTLTVQVPSRFYYEWIEGHYSDHIDSALDRTLGGHARLIYVTGQQDDQKVAPAPLQVKEVVTPPTNGGPRVDHGLNPRYLFSTFIEGPQNQFARAAALAVGKSPGRTAYNPMLIYGGVGLGKTHLLQAIGNEALIQNPRAMVRYISSERFTQDFVEAIKANRADEFSARYRAVDVLLMDDVQFLVGRERTQMEFFHTFNTLHQSGKQIVLTSDKPPRELDGLDERLVSRFGWGLVTDIAPPDFDTRIAIIQKLSEEEGLNLDPRVLDYLASHFTKNVREMQGALIRLMAHASLTGSEISPEMAHRALQDLVSNRERRITVEIVRRVVAEHFQVAPDLLMAKIRTQPIARARMIAMALSVRLTGQSLKQVGAQYGKRDHTTVLHARDKLDEWEQDPAFASQLEQMVSRIESESE